MKKGIIFINGYTQSVTELNQPNRIREELDLLGVKMEIRRNLCFSAGLNSRSEIVTDCRHFDFCVYLDKDKYLPRMLEGAGLRLFNCARAVELCDDKMATFIALQGTGLRIPKTFAAPLNYTLQAPVNCDMLEKISEELRFPLVVKECYGSLGKGVYLVKNMTELQRIAEELKGKPHLFQEFVSESAGKDLRVIAIGGEVVSCMRRVSDKDFRSNAELGGRGELYALPEDAKAIARCVANSLGLNYCGIDLLFGKDGLVLCEVNSNAYFATMERVSGVNVAKAYASHIVREVYGE